MDEYQGGTNMTYHITGISSKKADNTAGCSGFSGCVKPLVGKQVKVNRGGPESKEGTLIEVKNDFFTLAQAAKKPNEAPQFVYFNSAHVKSVTEDSKENSMQGMIMGQSACSKVASFKGVLASLKGQNVQLNYGPESSKGLLVDVVDNYVVLCTKEDGIVYLEVEHIKSVTPIIPKQQDGNRSQQASFCDNPSYIKTSSFKNLFKILSNRWVALNVGGPEAIEGVLVISSKCIEIVNNTQIIRINPSHVRSISEGPRKGLKQAEKQNQQENGQENQQAEGAQQTQQQPQQQQQQQQRSQQRSNRSRGTQQETVVRTRSYKWRG